MEFLIINGEIIRKEDANFTSFFWDEPLLLSHKMWFGYGGIPLFQENLSALCRQLNALGAPVPGFFQNNRELFRITKRMLNKNKWYRSGWIHVQLFVSNTLVNFAITGLAAQGFEFPVSAQGIMVNFSPIIKNSQTPFNQFSYTNHAFWMAHQAKAHSGQAGNTLFLNQSRALCDANSSNIYLLKNNTLYTPSVDTGCYKDVLRKYILDLALELGFSAVETDSLLPEEAIEMDEIFLVGEARGFEWVLGLGKKRFVKKAVVAFHRRLNALLKEKAH